MNLGEVLTEIAKGGLQPRVEYDHKHQSLHVHIGSDWFVGPPHRIEETADALIRWALYCLGTPPRTENEREEAV